MSESAIEQIIQMKPDCNCEKCILALNVIKLEALAEIARKIEKK